jgi:pilus assembly protein FimV
VSEYGPVQANDTAWSLAKQLRPRGVSMEQMMMALLAANPQAFVDNNINRLRRGRILRVPSVDEINAMSRQEARAAYRQQQDEWLARKDQKLQQAAADRGEGQGEGAAASAAADDQLRIATARPDGEGEAGASEIDATTPTSGDLESRLIAARENAETSRQEAETLRTQVDGLQERLENMQKLLSLKDEQLARLQDQVLTEAAESVVEPAPETDVASTAELGEAAPAESPEGAVEGAVATTDLLDQVIADAEAAAPVGLPSWVPSEGYTLPSLAPQIDPDRIVEGREPVSVASDDIPVQIDPDKIVDQAAAAAGLGAVQTPSEEVVIEAEPAMSGPAEADTVVIEGDTAAMAGAASEAPAIAQVAEPAAAGPAPVAEDEPATSAASLLPADIAGMVEKNIVPIAGGSVALLALLGWLFTRGRRRSEEGEVLAGVGATTAAAADAEAAVDQPAIPDETLNDLPDSAFLDEFSPSDINALQDETGEVDPVSEADVYIAYGRYQQAQELLRQALTREPDRLALKHKLLEVHYATRDADAFTALAQEMVDAGQDAVDEEAWVRAQDMGRELAPANELFSAPEDDLRSATAAAGVAAAAAGAAAAAAVDDDTLTLDEFDMSDLADEYDATKDADDDLEAPSEVSITLDLEDESTEQPLAALDTEEITDSLEPLSLDDMETLDLEQMAGEKVEQLGAETEELSDSLDLDSMMADAEAAVDESSQIGDSEFSADELQAQLDELSDLSAIGAGGGESLPPAEEPPANLGVVSEDQTTVSESLDEPIDLDAALETADIDEAGPETIDLDDLSEGAAGEEDDVATKLDLARAYVDMGDDDGARSILDEVITEGNTSQKGEAEKLLAEL